MNKRYKDRLWLFYAVVGALLWGVWAIISRAISADIDPFTCNLLYTIGLLFTIPFVIQNASKKKPQLKGFIWALIAGLFSAMGNVAIYKAFINGGMASIVMPLASLYPLITIVIALLLYKQKLNLVNTIGMLLALPAVVILSGRSLFFSDPSAFFKNFQQNSWLVYSLVALLFWAIFGAIQKKTANYISKEWYYVSFIISSAIISLIFIICGQVQYHLSLNTWLLGSLAGFLNGLGILAVGFAAYLAKGNFSKITIIAGVLHPVFTIVLAILFLSESLSGVDLMGIILVTVSIVALSYNKNKNADKPTPRVLYDMHIIK